MSLKHKYADEIAASMAKSLEDEAFMGQFRKEAAASNEEAVRDAISRGDKAHCVDLYNTYFGGGEGDTALQSELSAKYGDDKAVEVTNELRGALYKICNPGPGSTFPASADDKCEKCHCEECECEKPEEDCQDCGDKGLNPDTEIALAFAMNHLVKVANALDNRGFSGVAEIVDEAVEKLAATKKVKKADILDDLEKGKPIDTGDYSNTTYEVPMSSLERNLSGMTGEYDEEGRLKEYDEDAEEKESEREIAEIEKQEKEGEEGLLEDMEDFFQYMEHNPYVASKFLFDLHNENPRLHSKYMNFINSKKTAAAKKKQNDHPRNGGRKWRKK